MSDTHLPDSELKVQGSFDRCVSLERTLSLIPELRRRFGITRIGDTTLLDRTNIPTACAVVPVSPDALSVYNGKGLTRDAAVASAVMEAVERQVGASPSVATSRLSVREICERLDLESLGLSADRRNTSAECAWGIDLVAGDAVAVPMALVQCPWRGEPLFPTTSTNGLASGNTLTEAVYHALAEVIERHVWSMTYVRCELVPRFYKGLDAADEVHAEELQFPTGNAVVDELAGRIFAAGLRLRVMMLREDGLPSVALATLVEPDSTPPMAHFGLGCSLTPAHCVVRAITEAAQSRTTDIQGARDVLSRADDADGVARNVVMTRRPKVLPKDRWTIDLPAKPVRLDDLPDRGSPDVAVDVRHTIDALCNARFSRIVLVDISPKDVPIAVVRVVVPGLESTKVDGRIGPRALELFNPFALA